MDVPGMTFEGEFLMQVVFFQKAIITDINGWWFPICFLCSSLYGEMIQF